jgi:hypothetical protein
MQNMSRRTALTSLFTIALASMAPMAHIAHAMNMSDEIEAENAIRDARRTPARIAQIRRVPAVGVINLNMVALERFGSRMSYMDASDFRIVASQNAGGVARMRRALAANRVTRAAVADQGVEIGDVVGVVISRNGNLRLFVLH